MERAKSDASGENPGSKHALLTAVKISGGATSPERAAVPATGG